MIKRKKDLFGLYLLLGTLAIGGMFWTYGEIKIVNATEPISPRGETVLIQPKAAGDAESHAPVAISEPEPDDIQKTDKWVGKYVDKYFTSHYGRSRIRATMQCLLAKESQHTFMTASDHHGDNGMAGGILQFWPETWTGFRKIMMDRGLVTEIGSRYNPEQAIETTVWALMDGREGNWGPINRQECLSTKGAK